MGIVKGMIGISFGKGLDMSKKGKKALQEIADDATYNFLASQSMNFTECAINLMMTTMQVKDVTEFLRCQIKILEEYE